VEFSSLLPGSYTFQVRPDINTARIVPVTNLYLTITPLWWQTTLTRFILIILILSLSAYIIRRRVKLQFERRLYEQKQLTLLESERNRIASDMHDDIGADLTKISIWSNILKSKIPGETVIVDKVARLSNDVLQKMDQIIWALNSIHNQTGHLLSYLHAYSSEYLESADISLRFESSDEIPNINIGTFQRRCVFLVIKELLHNTVKHSEAKNVTIKVSMNNNKLIIDYSNDGIKFNENEKGMGLGLTTMKNRMSEINSTIEFTNSPDNGFHAQLIIDIHYKTKF
jgi:signal transduction histidine kinase